MKTVDYLVAENLIRIVYDDSIDIQSSLSSFIDFEVPFDQNAEAIVHVEIVLEPTDIDLTNAKLLSDVSIIWGDRFKFEETEQKYVTSVENGNAKDTEIWRMISD